MNKELIQKEIDDPINTLNEKDEEGDEIYSQYRSELEYQADEEQDEIDNFINNNY